jgi:hypothetical protein
MLWWPSYPCRIGMQVVFSSGLVSLPLSTAEVPRECCLTSVQKTFGSANRTAKDVGPRGAASALRNMGSTMWTKFRKGGGGDSYIQWLTSTSWVPSLLAATTLRFLMSVKLVNLQTSLFSVSPCLFYTSEVHTLQHKSCQAHIVVVLQLAHYDHQTNLTPVMLADW